MFITFLRSWQGPGRVMAAAPDSMRTAHGFHSSAGLHSDDMDGANQVPECCAKGHSSKASEMPFVAVVKRGCARRLKIANWDDAAVITSDCLNLCRALFP